ncbi:putative Annexin A1 [Amylocarpus encephaloides]|uniref:Annexin A1 n=1 Tax=Amylocarpus encephaloides TaxID=45428 RepID=A0A9P7YCQ3_9HELO|nr:putative Annexin A1 [Amylocarpus encephaloides]
MSLDPRDSRTRGRSKSPGRHDRDSSRVRIEERESSRVRHSSPPSSRFDDPHDHGGYEYEERETITRSARDRDPAIVTAEPRDSRYGSTPQYRDDSPPRDSYGMPGAFDSGGGERDARYNPGGWKEKEYYKETASYATKDKYGRDTSPPPRSKYVDDKYPYQKDATREYERDPAQYEDGRRGHGRGASFNVATKHSSMSGAINLAHDKHGGRGKHGDSSSDDDLAYGSPPKQSHPDPKSRPYAQPEELIYSKRQETTAYDARPGYSSRDSRERLSSRDDRDTRDSRESKYRDERHGSASYAGDSARSSKNHIVTVDPRSRRRDPSPNPMSGGLAPRMHGLSLSTGHHGGVSMSLANAPGSPLLEAYHGTYQSISPMPSPLMTASGSTLANVDVMDPLSPGSSDDERYGIKKARRTARFHDPEEEASTLARALKGSGHPDTRPLIDILPGLTHEQILELRVEYKRIVKTGSDKKGVNIAKHLKVRLKSEDPSFAKACYAVALGRWESEAYWANFWYQGEKSRRELLIESLMGRTNREIREIKEGFSDKKYSDSLTKCMKTELKEDKFKKAVLMVLDEQREEESRHGPDSRDVEDDVDALYKAVRSEKGGESRMISIIVMRSDTHLREILRVYEGKYRANFAREMLKRSGNLVGELLAHILNGVINKPVRDALLIHHALSASKSDNIRTELLISRLVRYHWDRPHMENVKREYRNRYGVDMQKAVKEGTRGEVGAFCEMLCVRRMGDEVREVGRREEVREYSRVEETRRR